MNAPLHTFNSLEEPFSSSPGRSSAVIGAPSLASILDKAKDLRPYLRERGHETEVNRRISEETTQIFKDLGFFKLLQPARYGGYEYGFTGFMDLISDIAILEHFANRFTGLDQWRQIGALVFVDRRRNGNNKAVAVTQIFEVRRVLEVECSAQLLWAHFQCVVAASLEVIDTVLVDIEADDSPFPAKLNRQRQTDITQANNG